MIRLVKEIEKVEPYRLALRFNTGEVKNIDMADKLKEWSVSADSKFRQLLDPEYFCTVKINTDLETVFWDNGIDFCPDTLYSWAD